MPGRNETILQFGGGRFLRAFIDRFVQHANEGGQNVGQIVVVQSTPGPRAELLNQQPDGYHVLVRGYEEGAVVDRVEVVRSIRRALIAATQWEQVLELARSPDLRHVVSNATETGYVLGADAIDAQPPQTLPAKLTRLLWERFQADCPPLVLLPCELIEHNADRLLSLVQEQARRWSLPSQFIDWITGECWWLNSLVDCIVTDGPQDHPLAAQDQLLICAEPYALWALQVPAARPPQLFRDPALVTTADVTPYFLRKVRILNALHTAMVCKFMPAGFQTVQQVMQDKAAVRWLRDLLFEEILPAIAHRIEHGALFADQVLDRFRNPFQAHLLSNIALNHAEKMRIRLLTTRQEYEALFGKPPRLLVELLAAPLGTGQ